MAESLRANYQGRLPSQLFLLAKKCIRRITARPRTIKHRKRDNQ